MARLGGNRYGKAEVRLVHVARTGDEHALSDLTVGVALGGDLADSHLSGDNHNVLPTDSQKNTVYALAREHGVGEIEAFAMRLARHFVASQPSIHHARVHVVRAGWRRLGPHSFQRDGAETRTATVHHDGDRSVVLSGLTDLVLLNSTDSEFHGYVRDRYTTLPETRDRILATAVTARWRHAEDAADWDSSYVDARDALLSGFTGTYSYALQQTLFSMGELVLQRVPGIVEVRLVLPNRHHFLVDLAPFGLDNPDEVYVATDRPYGLIEGTVLRDGAAESPEALWIS